MGLFGMKENKDWKDLSLNDRLERLRDKVYEQDRSIDILYTKIGMLKDHVHKNNEIYTYIDEAFDAARSIRHRTNTQYLGGKSE